MEGDDIMEKRKYQVEIIGRTGYVTDTISGQVYHCPLLNGPEHTEKFMKGNPTDEAIRTAFDLC